MIESTKILLEQVLALPPKEQGQRALYLSRLNLRFDFTSRVEE